MSPDRSHLHHILLDMGLRHRHVVISMYALTALAAGLGMFMMLTCDVGAVIIFFCVLVLLVLVFRVVGAVTLRETIAAWRRKHAISHQTKQEIENFEKVQLHFHQAKSFGEWWQSVCFAADEMGFVSGSLPLTNRDGTKRMLAWVKNSKNIGADNIIEITLPVRDRRAGPPLNLEVRVQANGSLESAGRRVTLFSRLLEEYSVANLPNKTKDTSSIEIKAVKRPLRTESQTPIATAD